MKISKAPLFLVAALAMSGCEVIYVSDHVFVDRGVMLTDASGNPSCLPSSEENCDTLRVDDLGEGEAEEGLPLKPGDILYLTYWSPGRIGFGTDSSLHPGGPVIHRLRVPIRHIFDYAKGKDASRTTGFRSLGDVERVFLANALITNRAMSYGGVDKQWLSKVLFEYEVPLWNALVDSLRLRRADKTTTATDECKAAFKVRGTPSENSITPAMDLCLLSKSLVSLTFNASGLRDVFPHKVDRDKFNAAFQLDRSTDYTIFDIAGLRSQPITPYDAITLTESGLRTNYYDTTIDGLARSIINFVEVELNGLDFRSAQMPERTWSLQDIEESGICGGDAAIVGFKLPHSGGGISRFSVSDDPTRASFEVQRVNRIRRQKSGMVGTKIVRKKHRLAGIFDVLMKGTSISRNDLDKIYITDVKRISWSGMETGMETASLRARCLMN